MLFFPSGITLSEATGWAPVFSIEFLVLAYLYITFFLVCPSMYYSILLYRDFESKEMRSKMLIFSFGLAGMFFGYYGMILYNIRDNDIFRAIWAFLSLIVVPSGAALYIGVIKMP